MRIGIVGNPENRRVKDFLLTASRLKMPPLLVVSWQDLLTETELAIERLRAVDLIRVESPGENLDVKNKLITLGGGDSKLVFGELGEMKSEYKGFCVLLDLLNSYGFEFQNSPKDIQIMFDKWKCHELVLENGLNRPLTAKAPKQLDEFRAWQKSQVSHSGRLFLKSRYSSSAAGVCAYRWAGDKEQLIAPIEVEKQNGTVRLFNSLRVRRYTTSNEIDTILKRLLPEGMVQEAWIPKARMDGGQIDFRVVVIAGSARHVVVRQSHYPMTNLHLGGRRIDLRVVKSQFGEELIEEVKLLAESAARCFKESLYAGVDVLVPRTGNPFVCEINAFGDLLPNLYLDGETTYQSILRATHDIWNTV